MNSETSYHSESAQSEAKPKAIMTKDSLSSEAQPKATMTKDSLSSEAKPKARRKGSARPKKSKGGGEAMLVVVTLVITLAIFVGAAMIFCMSSHSGEPKWVYIPKEATAESVRDSLRSSLGAREGNRVFALWRLIKGAPSRANGAYCITSGLSVLTTARALRSGSQTPVKVRFRGGRDINDAARDITRNLECDADSFIAACRRVLGAEGFTPPQYPAALLPDTYEFYWNERPDRLVERLLQYRNKFWTEERRAKAARLGLSPTDVATLASIVEEESAKRDERPTIARLYMNRLAKKMPLQADPTVKFATGNPRLRRITGEHTAIESPYNTYKHTGLPPGPIRIAESATIDAVLNAPANNYIYMCAREDFSGYHNFASDYSTHLANAARYHRELNRRGIK